jgi:hypothetical protein
MQTTSNVSDIKKIDQNEFKQIINYYNEIAIMYDEKAQLASQAVIDSKNNFEKNMINNSDDPEKSRFIMQKLNDHKSDITTIINELNNTYSLVSNNKSVSSSKIESFNKFYENYKNNSFYNNESLQNRIDSAIFTSNKSNIQYYKENHVYEKIKEANDKINSKFIIQAITNNKPKI